MNDENDPLHSDRAFSGEHWTVAPADRLEQLFRLLAIPPLPGYAPVAVTAVGASMSASGAVAHYPTYAQLSDVNVTEETELRAAIVTLVRGLSLQRARRGARRLG